MDIPVVDLEGKEIKKLTVEEPKTKPASVYYTLRWYLLGRRRGTSSTKTRGEVSGGGRKPWKQKGTGRARAGSIRSPLWKKGGIVFGPKPRSWLAKLPNKVKHQAVWTLIIDKAKAAAVKIVEEINLARPKTREFKKFQEKLGVSGKVLFVLEKENKPFELAGRNVPGCSIKPLTRVNIVDLLGCDQLVFEQAAFEKMREAGKNNG